MAQVTDRLNVALAERYVIERELGQGGMATVYLANDLKHDRKVAIKVLRPELAAVLGAERFVQEIKTTAHLQHPNILPLFDSGEADGFLYYVMPYIEGETLRDKLNRERQLGIEESVRIATEVAQALDSAHRQNVIHRDIKPENILLHDGRPLVADFGIALAVSAAAGGRMTETGLSLGTPHYMSPEQATAEKEITERSDVYSLASVLYEMLAGEPPHTGATAQGIIMKIVTEEAAPVTRMRKSVPTNVAEAVATALEKLPADRFPSAAAFAEALAAPAFTRTRASAADAPARLAPAAGWRPLAIGLALVAVVAGAAGWWWGRRGVEAPAVARQRIVLGSGPERVPELVAFRAGLHPQSAGILFADTNTTGGRTVVTAWWKPRDAIEATAMPSMDGAISPTFSPDGEWVAFVQSGDLRKQPLRGGNSVTLASGVTGGTAHALAWLDDGTILFENANFILQRIPETGQGEPVTVSEEAVTGQPIHAAGLPGGGAALISACVNSCPGGTMLSLLDLDADTAVKLVDGVVRAWPAPDGYIIYLTREGGVFAARLDRGARRLGPPVPLFEGVRVSTDANGEMHVARDGTALFVRGTAASGTFRVVQVDRGGRAVSIGAYDAGPQPFTAVALSPDGRRMAYTLRGPGGEQLWVGEIGGGPLLPLTPTETSAQRPAWFPDGSRIAYVSVEGGRHIRSVRADGTSTASDTVLLQRAVYEVAFTPKGDTIVVRMNNTAGSADVYMAAVRDPQAPTPLLTSPAAESALSLSPDGRWLAYVSDVTGNNEVYVRPFPNVAGGQVAVSVNGGVEPVWAHSGREIFYRDRAGWMVAAQVATDSTFRVVERTRLFNASGYATHGGWHGYDVLPGDRGFVMFQPGPGGVAEVGDLILVENLFEELKLALKR
jgi:eukaryotic-like serine/threonine-protein kinase